ncbi:hypothetical protein EN817_06535 [Mesorhizobium sp. M3A.F.Ca.ET.174.01.1.1]|nr:hypothetical protein EJ074_20635 [Mesorhizobium sp. M3A.F.Ca.ET.080.04.2.1]PBB88872.1 hypothetical protein CK216_01985 [Mesorhizobium sp. WSM3876]RWB76546.1 MAG: hypothetical protein EOQ49_01650 [Mesorhizobium sp.]TGS70450.1 hypothetical protein EN844_06840 [Mesorhizobium sp. M3A.F.Ca.ET.201.01.1.1]TGS88414.1 hypothetical protein EN818_06530 [Mesorhizobium sp. M3A.F.Ca.ET.175.01.1.1]TGT29360.1 hypothetical protein EN817_06535 [Mesorhizobium sp. M3A.F.Ca.ET.174.01.1.1]TGT64001.1 hypothetica
MLGRLLAFVLCPALLAASGCARSDDGTVIIPKPLDVRRVWDKAPPGAAPPSQTAADVFPQPPPSPPTTAAPRRYFKPSAGTPSLNQQDAASGPQRSLACRNVSEPGKRYRVVCK